MAAVSGSSRKNSFIFCCWRSMPSLLMVTHPRKEKEASRRACPGGINPPARQN
jgi:hypothetical protein